MAKQLQLAAQNDCIEILRHAQIGDMIEFNRGSYSHWAIYIGDESVIHRWGVDDGIGQPIGFWGLFTTVSGAEFDKAFVVQTNLRELLECDGKVRVNNYLDRKYKPLPVEEIVRRARSALDQEGYNVIRKNCEHFTTDCRYGQENSRQVQLVIGSSLIGAGLLAGLLAAIAYLASQSSTEGRQKNKKKALAYK